MSGCDDLCAFPKWRSDGTFRPKSTPTLPKEFLDKLNSRKFAREPSEPFKPSKEPKVTAKDISGIQWRGSDVPNRNHGPKPDPNPVPKPFEPKFVPSLEGVAGISTVNALARRTVSVKPYTEEDVNKILDLVYNHTTEASKVRRDPTRRDPTRRDPTRSPTTPRSTPRSTPHHVTPKRCVDSKTERRARFVFGYMRELIGYIRTTTAVNYVPEGTVPPNVSHKMVTFVGTKINKLVTSDPKILGTRRYTKVRLYKKIYIPLVIAVRHRDELMRLRVAHKEVRADYAEIMQRLDKRATVGVSLSVPAINQDIMTYIERYGMPEEFLFDPQLMQGIKNEAMG